MKTPLEAIGTYFLRQGKQDSAMTQSREIRYLDLGWVDSLSVLEFVAYLEAEFSVRISDDELVSEEFTTLGGVADIVSRHIQDNR